MGLGNVRGTRIRATLVVLGRPAAAGDWPSSAVAASAEPGRWLIVVTAAYSTTQPKFFSRSNSLLTVKSDFLKSDQRAGQREPGTGTRGNGAAWKRGRVETGPRGNGGVRDGIGAARRGGWATRFGKRHGIVLGLGFFEVGGDEGRLQRKVAIDEEAQSEQVRDDTVLALRRQAEPAACAPDPTKHV